MKRYFADYFWKNPVHGRFDGISFDLEAFDYDEAVLKAREHMRINFPYTMNYTENLWSIVEEL